MEKKLTMYDTMFNLLYHSISSHQIKSFMFFEKIPSFLTNQDDMGLKVNSAAPQANLLNLKYSVK